MTYLIARTSTKSDRAMRFGKELERAMKARDVGTRTVAEALGSSRTSIMYWRTGRLLPRIETARRLAAALDWESLATLAIELRRKVCPVDQVEFVDDSGSDNRLYCSASCQRVQEKIRAGSTIDKRAANAERRLTLFQQSVAAYCGECEPSGRCVTAGCPLRPVSPLPLYETQIDVQPVASRSRNRWEGANTAADSVRQRSVWARYTPEERAARVTRAAEASKRARGLAEATA